MADAVMTGASGQTYTFNFGTNAACKLEEATGKSYGEVMNDLKGPTPSVRLVRQFMQAAIVGDQMDLEAVGAAIDDVGGWAILLGVLNPDSPYAASVRELLAAVKDGPAVVDPMASTVDAVKH